MENIIMRNENRFVEYKEVEILNEDGNTRSVPSYRVKNGKEVIKPTELEKGTPAGGKFAGKTICRVFTSNPEELDNQPEVITDDSGNVIKSFAMLGREEPEVFDELYSIVHEYVEIDGETGEERNIKERKSYGKWVMEGKPSINKGGSERKIAGPGGGVDPLPTPGEDGVS